MGQGRWTVPNLHVKDNVSFACTVHVNGRCLITVSLYAGACKWTVACSACMHEIYSCVGALLCFLACKLAGTCSYLCVKKIWMVPSCALWLAIFFVQQKRSEKKARSGACMSRCACERVRSARGAERKCAAVLMVVGSAHAPLPGIGQSERAREMSSRHVMLMPCCTGYIWR